jgi:Cdc6-like AAA superfamily ATPase
MLAAISVVIIIVLAFYAGILINKIKKQKVQALKIEQAREQLKKQKIQERNNNIVESIRFIAKATMQKQCNVSEAAIRLTVLLETLQIKEAIDIATSYPALTAMYEKVKDMPTHEERKTRPVKEIKMLDLKRELFEAEMEHAIIKETAILAEFAI